ncbi:MAG: heme lyase CcmF/NrfE family subunit [Alphaproteobacteria bacterium]|nr:heme lyase CcmF/NrfE family subunit [Alphaproteobacteria bacterium]
MAEIGHFTLALSAGTALIMAIIPMLGAALGDTRLMRTGRMAALVLLGQILFAFGLLTTAFLRSDFSVKLVAIHSHSLKPVLYKIAGVWGNHEGSLLLWVLILGIFSSMVAISRGIEPHRQARVVSVQGMIAFAFLLFMLMTSNPFLRLEPAPLDGKGLNPLLQDPGLAFHPPMLYLGYVGLSVAFSFAVAALLEGKADKDWARQARPFILAAWSALTLGIALGSWWAYYELGWGGWWFWDPVENASLLPWLIATALIHSVIVVEKRNTFKTWTVLLAILGFALSLLGTFIVRSGLLTSVHAFATDPARGMIILVMLMLSIGGPLLLFALRGDRLASRDTSALLSRETALAANNLLLVVATATVLIGTLYPLGLEAWNGARISVGPPFYNATFAPLMGLMVIIMVAGPLIAWHRAESRLLLKRLIPSALLVVVGIGASTLFLAPQNVTALATIGLAIWLIGGTLTDIAVTTGFLKAKPRDILQRLCAVPLSRWGMNTAHMGVAVFILGAAGSSFFQSETIERVFPGEILKAGSKIYRLEEVKPIDGPNYSSTAAVLSLINDKGQIIDTMISEIRFYPVAGTTTTEAAIRPRIDGDAYAVLGDGDGERGYVLRLYDKPLVSWIWFGAGLMALGGIIAIGRPTPAENEA